MPSITKTIHFLSSATASVAAVGILGYGMSTDWATSTMICSRQGDDLFNGSAILELGLFDGVLIRDSCPTFGGKESFKVLGALAEVGGVPQILSGVVVLLLALCLLCSAGSILLTLYNSVSNPYETYMGPIGLYTFSSTSACLSMVTMVVYAVNVTLTRMSELLLENSVSGSVDLRDKRADMKVGFFLLIPYLVLNLLAILVVYLYEHAAYTQRQEQQKPTEDAPKEIMMY